MSDRFIQTNTLSNIANAIRYRANTTFNMPIEDDSPYVITFQKVLKENVVFSGFNFDHDYGGIIVHGEMNTGGVIPRNDIVIPRYTTYLYAKGFPFVENALTNVYNIYGIFNNFRNMYGQPSSSPHIQNAASAYWNCINLTGHPVIENKPNKFEYDRITGTWFENGSGHALNVYGMYYNCTNLTGNAEFGGCLTTDLSYLYYNCHNLNGSSFYLTVEGSDRFYPKNLESMMYNCTNYRAVLNNRYPSLRNTLVNDFDNTFFNCSNLTGEPIAFDGDYTRMRNTYQNCKNLTGNGCCGPLVTSMQSTFENCYNLNGCGIVGIAVKTAYYTYRFCNNLQSANILSPVISDIPSIFSGCTNLKGSVILLNPVENATYAFNECSNLQGVYFPGNNLGGYNYVNAFKRSAPTLRLNVVFNNYATLVNMCKTEVTNCTMTAIQEVTETVKLPLVEWHGRYEIGHELYQAKHKCYNEEYKLYMYSTE